LAALAISLKNCGLVDEAADFLAAQGCNYPLDLTPMAKAGDVAIIPAAFGSSGRLEARIVAKALHQICRIGKSKASVDEGCVHGEGQ
jgi:hypothetical protein